MTIYQLGTDIYNALAELENLEIITVKCFISHVENSNGDPRIKAIFKVLDR